MNERNVKKEKESIKKTINETKNMKKRLKKRRKYAKYEQKKQTINKGGIKETERWRKLGKEKVTKKEKQLNLKKLQ